MQLLFLGYVCLWEGRDLSSDPASRTSGAEGASKIGISSHAGTWAVSAQGGRELSAPGPLPSLSLFPSASRRPCRPIPRLRSVPVTGSLASPGRPDAMCLRWGRCRPPRRVQPGLTDGGAGRAANRLLSGAGEVLGITAGVFGQGWEHGRADWEPQGKRGRDVLHAAAPCYLPARTLWPRGRRKLCAGSLACIGSVGNPLGGASKGCGRERVAGEEAGRSFGSSRGCQDRGHWLCGGAVRGTLKADGQE